MDGPQKLKLQLNQPAVWAEETLRERGTKLTAESLRHLTMLATGDQDKADEAYARRVLEETRPT